MNYYKLGMFILSFLMSMPVNSYSQPNIYVDPPNQVVYGQKTVTVNFRVSNVTNIRSYNVVFVFNNSVLKYKSSTKGNFLSNNGMYSTLFSTIQQGVDTLNIAEAILGGGLAVSGSGLLFSVQFDILSYGQSPITITSIKHYDVNNHLIIGTFNSGYTTVAGRVLVVDDDVIWDNKTNSSLQNWEVSKSPLGSSASLFTSSLTTAGYFVNQVNFNSLDTNTLNNYDLVILSAGNKEDEIFNNSNKRLALVNYTLNGGKTLVEGGDVGYIFRKEDETDIDPEFRRNLLLDSVWSSDRIGTNLQITNSTHPIFRIPNNISSPTTITVNNGGLTGSGARDEMTMLSKTGINRIANWVGGTISTGGIIIYNTNGDTAKCRNIFFTFSISQFADQTIAEKLIVNTARYLLRDLEPPIKMLNLKALIEGLYSGSVMIPDTMNVELRTASPPFNLVEAKKIKLDTLGSATMIFSTAKNENPYYLIVKHRNSIETWSAIGKIFSSGFLSFDFTTDSAKAYGNNMKKKGTKWCIFSGDINQDGFVNSVDLNLIANDAYNFSSGYKTTDITGDNFVDLNDIVICDDNAYKLVRVLNP